MTKQVEFLFDFVSPASYIAYHVLPRIAEAAGAEIVWTPVFLGGIMQATGNRPPGTVEAKGRWMRADIARWAGLYGLDYRRNSNFPVMTLPVMRGALALRDDPVFRPYCDAVFRAMWVDDVNLGEADAVARVVASVGLDPEGFRARISEPAAKEALKAQTDDAVARGVFGAPSFFVGETLHFGQDRLFMVAEDLGVSIHDALADGR